MLTAHRVAARLQPGRMAQPQTTVWYRPTGVGAGTGPVPVPVPVPVPWAVK